MAGGKAASKGAERRILGKAGLNNGKSALAKRPAQPSIRCPECGSTRVWKDGLRSTRHGDVQRWLCRDCGFRFSQTTADSQVKVHVAGKSLKQPNPGKNLLQTDVFQSDVSIKPAFENLPFKRGEHIASHISSKQTIVGKALNTFADYNRERRVCVSKREAKNLVKVETRQKRAAGATWKSIEADVKGKIVEYAWWMKKNGYADTTIRVWLSVLNALRTLGADLTNPESVKETIAKAVCLKGKVGKPWSDARRHIAIAAYTLFLKTQGKKWDPPLCHVTRKLPFIPTEQELDALIAGCGRKTAAFLQLLKETAMRAGEARKLLWMDIDFERRIITLNTPEKRGNPRIFKVSSKLVNMLATLPKVDEKVFSATMSSLKTSFYHSRKRLARKLQNPRLLHITFHTFRHWKATMLYHQTHDPLYVKEFLGHKKMDTTLLYIQIEKTLYKDDSDEFTVKVASNPEEIKALLEVGFQYVCEKDSLLYFRKRK